MSTEIVNVIVMEMFNVVSCHSYTKANVNEAEEKFKVLLRLLQIRNLQKKIGKLC